MATRYDHAGAAVDTTLGGDITAGDTTAIITDATGWPSGAAAGEFWVAIGVIDSVSRQFVSNVEKVKVGSRTGTTLSSITRGQDDTTAQGHSAGETVRHIHSADEVHQASEHAGNTAVDDHTQYLNIARHDDTARHTPGTVIPVGTPGTILPDDAAAAGAAATLARSDHKHAIATAAPGTIAPDDAAAEGVSTSFARADHTHAIGAAAPSDVGTANAEGVSTSFARADHVHNDPYCRAYEVDNAAAAVTLTTTYQNVCDASLSLPAGIYVFVGQARGAASVSTPVTHTYRIRNTTDAVDIGDEVSAGIDDRTADNEHSSAIVATATLAATKTIQLQGKTDTLNGTQFSDDSRLVAIRVAALT